MSESENTKLQYAIINKQPSGQYIDLKSIRENMQKEQKEDERTYKEFLDLLFRFSK